jgi:hypothetical protein
MKSTESPFWWVLCGSKAAALLPPGFAVHVDLIRINGLKALEGIDYDFLHPAVNVGAAEHVAEGAVALEVFPRRGKCDASLQTAVACGAVADALFFGGEGGGRGGEGQEEDDDY